MKDSNESKGAPPSRSRVEEELLKARTLMIFGEINQEVAKAFSERILVLDRESNEPIRVFINSEGGHVESGDTIFDMIRFVASPVKVIGTGWVASAGALIFAAAQKENRLCLPNTRFMIHQPLGGVRGQASDIGIEAQEILKMRDRLNQTFAEQTGQPLERIERDSDRNFWMSAEEAQAYGLVGRIIKSVKEI
ncbi:MAG: ATP-dependent Clp protease proteolytic subunit [Verrucomicrobiia bacterium]